MTLWKRYLLTRVLKTFSFFFFCILFIYIVADLSVHGVRFLSHGSFSDLFFYYVYTFSTLLELFLTLTFLLSIIRVLHDLNSHRELLALQMTGISKKKLTSPLLWIAAAIAALCYLNNFTLASKASEMSAIFRKSHKKKREERLHLLPLEDQSELVYQKKENGELFDVFWVKKPDDLWHMKSLNLTSMEAKFVHHFVRNEKMQLTKLESFPAKTFSEFKFSEAPRRINRTSLYYKLLSPLLSFLALFTLAPILLRYTRSQAVFLTTACSVFGLIALKVILDGMTILGENQVLSAWIAILVPISLAFGAAIPKFIGMK